MINIKVLKDYAEVSYQQSGSAKLITKIIGVSEIPGLFETKITYDSGILPVFGQQNAYGIQRIIQRDQSTIVLIQAINPFANVRHTEYSPLNEDQREALGIGHIKTLSEDVIQDEEEYAIYKNIYFPNLLMSLHLKKDKHGNLHVGGSGLLGFKDSFVTDETQLYDLPYSNLYRGGSHGGICWGNQSLAINSVAQSVGILHNFLGATMNKDLFDEFDIHDYEVGCSSKMLAYLALRANAGEITSFPHDDIQLEPLIKYKGLIAYLTEQWK